MLKASCRVILCGLDLLVPVVLILEVAVNNLYGHGHREEKKNSVLFPITTYSLVKGRNASCLRELSIESQNRKHSRFKEEKQVIEQRQESS